MTAGLRHFLVGVTTLVAAVGFVVLLLFFGELEPLLSPRYRLVLETPNAAGLREGSPVELNGVPAGTVEEVEVRPDDRYPVQIVAAIQPGTRIPSEVVPYAATSLLGGSATLQLEGRGVDMLPADGTARIQGPLRSRMLEEFAGQLDSRMEPIGEAMEELRRLASNLNELLRRPAGPDEESNLYTTVELLNAVLTDIREALALAKGWLDDEQLQADARAAVHNAGALIEQATETLDRYTELAGHIQADADALTERLLPVMDELGATLAEVRVLVRRADSGDGTVAQLLNNPDLYRSLDDAAVRLERTLRELQLLVEKIQAEGLLW